MPPFSNQTRYFSCTLLLFSTKAMTEKCTITRKCGTHQLCNVHVNSKKEAVRERGRRGSFISVHGWSVQTGFKFNVPNHAACILDFRRTHSTQTNCWGTPEVATATSSGRVWCGQHPASSAQPGGQSFPPSQAPCSGSFLLAFSRRPTLCWLRCGN